MPTLHRPIATDHARLAEICRRHHVRESALFGSVLRGDFNVNSDIDMLVTLDEDARLGRVAFGRLRDERRRVTVLCGRPRRRVDMVER